MGSPVPRYAKSLVKTMRTDVAREQRKMMPPVDTAEVVNLKGGVQVRPSQGDVVYDEDDVFWNVDPAGLKVGDTVTLLRDPDDNPIVAGLSDGMNPDPALHPTFVKLRNQFDRLKATAATWKPPVSTFADLPASGNKPGDIRLVAGQNRLYRWRISGGVGSWLALDWVSSETVANNYTANLNDEVLLATTAGGAVNINLPNITFNGFQLTIKWIAGANPLTVTPLAGTIDGAPSFTFGTLNEKAVFHSHGGNWYLL